MINERILISTNVCHGKPVIKNTRVLVSNILAALSSEDSIDKILEDYPNITHKDVLAALQFGSQLCNFETYPYEI